MGDATSNLVLTQLTTSAVITYGLEKLKESKYFPWLTAETKNLNRLASIVLAGAGALGVHAAWDPSNHTLMITGLYWTSILHGAWDWIRSWVSQQLIYDMAVQKPKVEGQ